jgi:hypothetical protein
MKFWRTYSSLTLSYYACLLGFDTIRHGHFWHVSASCRTMDSFATQ